jgi:hypothetical protein
MCTLKYTVLKFLHAKCCTPDKKLGNSIFVSTAEKERDYTYFSELLKCIGSSILTMYCSVEFCCLIVKNNNCSAELVIIN